MASIPQDWLEKYAGEHDLKKAEPREYDKTLSETIDSGTRNVLWGFIAALFIVGFGGLASKNDFIKFLGFCGIGGGGLCAIGVVTTKVNDSKEANEAREIKQRNEDEEKQFWKKCEDTAKEDCAKYAEMIVKAVESELTKEEFMNMYESSCPTETDKQLFSAAFQSLTKAEREEEEFRQGAGNLLKVGAVIGLAALGINALDSL
jgi:hypothetical protein